MKNQRDKNGKKHGLWEEYYSSGSLLYRRLYKHGKRHGLLEWYYPGGNIDCKGAFKRGIQVGLWYEPDK